MKNNFSKAAIALMLTGIVITGLGLALTVSMSCTKTLDGEFTPNQAPIVYFVNIPPEGEQFSRNPVVNWVGTDRDGLITAFYYHVVTVNEMANLEPSQYAEGLVDSDWIIMEIDPRGPDPQTSNVVSMSANLTDPVRSYVDQYVFLKAVDEQGMYSEIIFRLFSRNDNPPTTQIWPVVGGRPSIDSEDSTGGAVTGVALKFDADDAIDYSSPPPFEFQWRLYGPYNEAEMADIESKYFTQVCVTIEGDVKQLGEEVVYCRSVRLDSMSTDGDSMISYEEDSCITIVCATDMEIPESLTHFVRLEDYFKVDDLPEDLLHFGDLSYRGEAMDWDLTCGRGAREYKCLAKDNLETWFSDTMEATWVPQRSDPYEDTLHNVYWNHDTDTTLSMDFVFWVRSRDDAKVPDLTPAFESFSVISPKFERDVVVIDFQERWKPAFEPNTLVLSPKKYWKDAFETWAAQEPRMDGIVFDTLIVNHGHWLDKFSAPDYIMGAEFDAGPPVSELLKHKVMVLYYDCLKQIKMGSLATIWTAIDAGVNTWATWRTSAGVSWTTGIDTVFYPSDDYEYRRYFGVEQSFWSGWALFTNTLPGGTSPSGWYQDFVGARSLNPTTWPELKIDVDLLHDRYNWVFGGTNFWENPSGGGINQNPALPEVNRSVLKEGTTTLYLYESSYGNNAHPLGLDHAHDGGPVGHVYYWSVADKLYKTAYFNFTPLAIESEAMQKVTNNIMSWLYFRDDMLPLDPGNVAPRPDEVTIEQAREWVRARQLKYGNDSDLMTQ